MHEQRHNLNIRWLISEINEQICVYGEHGLDKVTLAANDKLEAGWTEILHLFETQRLVRSAYQFNPAAGRSLLPVCEAEGLLGEPMLIIQVLGNGRGVLLDLALNAQLELMPERIGIEFCDRLDQKYFANPTSPLEIVILLIPRYALHSMLGEKGAEELHEALGVAKLNSATTLAVPRTLLGSLLNAVPDHLPSHLRRLVFEARMLDFLVALSVAMVDRSDSPSERDRAVLEAKRELDMWEGGPLPNLENLARRHGLTASALSNAFKRQFGQTCFAYVNEQRFRIARQILRDSDVPQKIIADRLGYSDISHFNRAFTNRFGYPPGNLRRKLQP